MVELIPPRDYQANAMVNAWIDRAQELLNSSAVQEEIGQRVQEAMVFGRTSITRDVHYTARMYLADVHRATIGSRSPYTTTLTHDLLHALHTTPELSGYITASSPVRSIREALEVWSRCRVVMTQLENLDQVQIVYYPA